MKDFWKTQWHCLTHLFVRGHRVCYYRPAGSLKREYFCECSGRLNDLLDF